MAVSPTHSPGAGLRIYLQFLWRRKWLIVMITVLGGLVAGGVTYLQTREYTATASILLQSGSPSASLFNGTGVSLSAPDVATQIEVVTSAPVQRAVSAKLHRAAPDVTVSQVGQTNVIQIAATNHSAATAAEVVNTYANAYITFRQQQDVNAALSAANSVQASLNLVQAQINTLQVCLRAPSSTGCAQPQLSSLETQQATLQSQLAQLQATTSLQSAGAELITPADAPHVPSWPQRKRTVIIGLFVGFASAVGGPLWSFLWISSGFGRRRTPR